MYETINGPHADARNAFVGKTILVDWRYYNDAGTLHREFRQFGTIERCSRGGIYVRMTGSNEIVALTPDYHALRLAPKGFSHDRDGEALHPEYLATWDVYPSGPGLWRLVPAEP
jgi:hypothetical protein